MYLWAPVYIEGKTEEDFECSLYLSLPNALEAGSLTESGARQTDDKAQPSSSLPPMALGLQAHNQLFMWVLGT